MDKDNNTPKLGAILAQAFSVVVSGCLIALVMALTVKIILLIF